MPTAFVVRERVPSFRNGFLERRGYPEDRNLGEELLCTEGFIAAEVNTGRGSTCIV